MILVISLSSGYPPGQALCTGCRTDLEPGGPSTSEYFYMLTDRLWTAIGMTGEPGQLLCVGCVEHRLGRELQGRDFKPGSSVNWPQPQDTPRLANRKKRISRPVNATYLDDLIADYQRLIGGPPLPPPRLSCRAPRRRKR